MNEEQEHIIATRRVLFNDEDITGSGIVTTVGRAQLRKEYTAFPASEPPKISNYV